MPDGGADREDITGPPETSGLGRGSAARRHRSFSPLSRWFSARGFLGRPALIAVAVAVPMTEAVAVDLTAPSARPLSPEVTALAPLAVFHDLRWLFGLGGTWPRFVLTLLAMVAARSVLDAVLAWLASRPAPAPAHPAARVQHRAHHLRGAAAVPAGRADVRGGPAAVLVAVPRGPPGADAVRPAAQPRQRGQLVVADAAAAASRGLAAGRVSGPVRGLAADQPGAHRRGHPRGRPGRGGQRPGLVRGDHLPDQPADPVAARARAGPGPAQAVRRHPPDPGCPDGGGAGHRPGPGGGPRRLRGRLRPPPSRQRLPGQHQRPTRRGPPRNSPGGRGPIAGPGDPGLRLHLLLLG